MSAKKSAEKPLKRTKTTVGLLPKTYMRLKIYAATTGRDSQDIIEDALAQYLPDDAPKAGKKPSQVA